LLALHFHPEDGGETFLRNGIVTHKTVFFMPTAESLRSRKAGI
jgi:hypothetical protein